MKKNYTVNRFLILALVFVAGFQARAQMGISTNVNIVCVMQPTNYVTATVTSPPTGVASYSWSILPSNCGLFLNASAGTATFNISCAGNYTISCSAYDSNSQLLSSGAAYVQAGANPAPVVNLVPSSTVGCAGKSYTVTYSGSFSYTTASVSGPTIFGSSFVITPTATTCYTVTGTNTLNCFAGSVFCLSVQPTPTVNVVASSTNICLGASATLVATGATTYSWSNSATGNVIVVAPTVSSLYYVTGTNSNGCTDTVQQVIIVNPTPTISLSASNTSVCLGQSVALAASGALTYTWNTGATGSQIVVWPASNTCYQVMGANSIGCTQSTVHCVTVHQGPQITITGNNTVCLGSSSTFTASGGTSYVWHNAATTNTINILPNATQVVVSVTATGTNGCASTSTTSLFTNSNCSDVWPGDANSDGNVTSTDVFEIGLGFNATGAARSPGGNNYVAQYAANWTGTISSGKNLCHADCNGDGTIDHGDTVAIFNNFGLTHAFKPSGSPTNPDVSLIAAPQAYIGIWNVADVVVGSSTANISQLYGVSFDLNFDINLIDDAYLVYTPSFFNASNQNVEFRKNFISNGKVVAATVRTDKNNVSGFGKIAELHYKLKNGLAENTQLDFSVSNSQKIGKDGLISPLVPGTMSQFATNNLVGLTKQTNGLNVQVFPNPVSKQLTMRGTANESISYTITDLSGRIVGNASFTGEVNVDVSALKSGVYFVEFKTPTGNVTQKIIVEHP